jgi:hypothetical protein
MVSISRAIILTYVYYYMGFIYTSLMNTCTNAVFTSKSNFTHPKQFNLILTLYSHTFDPTSNINDIKY